MFPKDTDCLAYADLSEARTYPWFAQFESQTIPVSLHNFEQFIESSGFGMNSHIDQVAWGMIDVVNSSDGPVPQGLPRKRLVGVLIGQFDPDSAQSLLKTLRVPVVQDGVHTFYASGSASGPDDVYFSFVGPDKIGFGPLEAIRSLLRTADGMQESLFENGTMFDLINQVNGTGLFWGVLDATAARSAVQQLVPEAARFPQSSQLIGKFKGMRIQIQENRNIQASFGAITNSPDDALLLSQLLQAGVLLQSFQARDHNPEAAAHLSKSLTHPRPANSAPSPGFVEAPLLLGRYTPPVISYR